LLLNASSLRGRRVSGIQH
ncbi:leu operon leader peptide, partial [Escherichia coli]|nr:leu operon leader peptide [Klebsiella pneumoniae]MCC7769891.1 leu operon leader peptide [Escherichia coli]